MIAGKYRLIRQLGQGGMGSVWLAEHLTLQSHVAVKLIHSEIAAPGGPTHRGPTIEDPMIRESVSRFLREAQAAASLRSPHVVQIFDYGVEDSTPYMVMELLEGESLADRLARVGRLSPGELSRFMTHCGRALSRAHEAGIVHRDLKPDNVFIVVNDDEEIAKILDFGIAKTTAAGSVGAAVGSGTRTGAVLGTPYYMSPEQAEGAKTLDHRTDIWAMGVMGFECLVGRKPFDADTLGGLLLAICSREMPVPSRFGSVPAGFDEWFARACARDLTLRFGSARDAAADLKRILEGSTRGDAPPSREPTLSSGGYALPSAHQSASSGLRGQTAPGLASTNGVARIKRRSSRLGIVLGLGLLAVGAVATAFLGLSRVKAKTPANSSALAPSQAPLVIPPAEQASVAPRSSPPTSAAVEAVASAAPASRAIPTHAKGASKQAAPSPANKLNSKAAAGTAAPVRSAPAAVPSPGQVNLGI